MAAASVLDNASKFNISSMFNFTSEFVPSARDLAMAGPRMFMKMGSFLTSQGPEAFDNIFGTALGQRVIAEATSSIVPPATATAAFTATAAREAVHAARSEILLELDEQAVGLASRFTLEGARSLGSVFGYATSRWALGCLFMAVVLNRSKVFASTQRNLSLPWKVRLLLRIMPIILLSFQARWLLQSIQCQTSPDFAELRWGNASKSSDILFIQNGGLLHTISSALLLSPTDRDSCAAVNMIPQEQILDGVSRPSADLTGSLALLWPIYKTFSLSQIVETVSCAVQGRQTAAETGMTLFEHSLAFAEADAAVGASLGWGPFGEAKIGKDSSNSSSKAEATHVAITRSMVMKRLNTTPEVLFVAFLSAMNHLTSQILGVMNLQGRLRLLNTGAWGLGFMAILVWSIASFSADDIPHQSLLRFPTVCIIGFIPHLLILFGILACSVIYATALALSALAPPTIDQEFDEQTQRTAPRSSFMHRLIKAHENMQANVPLAAVRISMHMDFYTALLRTGFTVMTMASEAVYLNENRGVNIMERTWLEEERFREMEDVAALLLGPGIYAADGQNSTFSDGLVPVNSQATTFPAASKSGYAREMAAPKKDVNNKLIQDGVGATERSGRWLMAFGLLLGITRLIVSWWASLTLRFLEKLGIRRQPRFLAWLVRRGRTAQPSKLVDNNHLDTQNPGLLSLGESLGLPKDENVDIEAEFRRRLGNAQGQEDEAGEKDLDSRLYSWFVGGGWWGEGDGSASFLPKNVDDDTTSIFSSTTESDWESDGSDDDGQRTPTQKRPHFSPESSPGPFIDTTLTSQDLAKLLHPKDPEQRAEAHALAAHLSSDKIMTRSRYRNFTQRERAQVLTSTFERPTSFTATAPGKLSPEEETQILEHLIISRRGLKAAAGVAAESSSWEKGGAGMGEGGPQCVVCQCSPRSIIVWPCRCLCLCDECRVTLAMQNYDKCVCCRRDVASFSRLFVP